MLARARAIRVGTEPSWGTVLGSLSIEHSIGSAIELAGTVPAWFKSLLTDTGLYWALEDESTTRPGGE